MRSSVGRAAVSKTACRRFKSCRACVEDKREYSFVAILAAIFLVLGAGVGVLGVLMQDVLVMLEAIVLVGTGIGWAIIAVREIIADE